MDELKSRLNDFKDYLTEEEKSEATIKKYLRDAEAFLQFAQWKSPNKDTVLRYKKKLIAKYAPASVNSMLTAVNRFLCFIGHDECRVRLIRIQKQFFAHEECRLTLKEYQKLLKAAENKRIAYVVQTIGSTGIRVSELQYITVEAVRAGKAVISCKNKTRMVLLPSSTQKKLREYMKSSNIKTGSIFVTGKGKPLDRSNIWKEMKSLCAKAQVAPVKVFPHNLRHLFARSFYQIDKDIVGLAGLLGHSNIDTARIYTMESSEKCFHTLESVGLLFTT